MSYEQQTAGLKETEEHEKGVEICICFKKDKPDPFHWGSIDCQKITRDEIKLIEKLDELKRDRILKKLFSLDLEARKLLDEGSQVAEVVINELVALRYEMKHDGKN